MAITVKAKTFIHDAVEAEDTVSGTIAADIKAYLADRTIAGDKMVSITHTQLAGDRIMTLVVVEASA